MERKKKKSLPKRFATAMRKNWQLYLMALPAMVLLFCFAYMPMGGLVIAFKRYNFKDGIWGSPWIDPIFKNFEILFKNNSVHIIMQGKPIHKSMKFRNGVIMGCL